MVRTIISTLLRLKSQSSDIVNFDVKSVDGSEALTLLNVCVLADIPAQMSQNNLDIDIYPHLQGINLPNTESSVKVDILIGQNKAEALIPLEVRKGKPNEPFAVRTLFGWCINGSIHPVTPDRQILSNFVSTKALNEIEEQVSRLWSLENKLDVEHGRCMSQEDKQVIDLWESSIRLHEGPHELPIPWRNPEAIIPNNYSVGKYRLESLKKSLVKKELFKRYDAEVEKMLTSGYAEKVPQAEIKRQTGRMWYLPHHGVTSDKKPGKLRIGVTSDKKPGKLRIVFDCAAKFEGESLNDKCYQGPDLNNKLLTVLLNFRLHPVGIMGDIEAMYNQVKISIKDRDALRFIWFKDDEIIHYRMTFHLFGGVWCASVATYALSTHNKG